MILHQCYINTNIINTDSTVIILHKFSWSPYLAAFDHFFERFQIFSAAVFKCEPQKNGSISCFLAHECCNVFCVDVRKSLKQKEKTNTMWKSESETELLRLSCMVTGKTLKYLIFSEQHFCREDAWADVTGSRVRWYRYQCPNLPVLRKHDEDVVTEFRADDLSRDPINDLLGLSRSEERCHDQSCPVKTLRHEG